MRGAILCIGDELLIGQVLNTNAAWLGEKMTALGVAVAINHVVGDTIDEIVKGLQMLSAQSEIILISGGLGPTHDDRTFEALGKFFGCKLKRDTEWLEKMRKFFADRGREMPASNERQILYPEIAERLDNKHGTAPGLWIEYKGVSYGVVPGVPYEVHALFEDFIAARIQKRVQGKRIAQKTLLTTGIGESAMAELLGDYEKFLNHHIELAFLPSTQGVRLRMTARENETFDPLETYLRSKLDKFIYGEGDEKMEEVIGKLLTSMKKTVAIAESCTGGLILSRLTDVPGSAGYVQGGMVAYQERVKIEELGVSAKLIEDKTVYSEEVACAMAEGIRKKLNADFGVATTGVAGPSGETVAFPVGTVCIAVASAKGTVSKRFRFEQERVRNKERGAQAALNLLRQVLVEESGAK